MRRFSLTLQPGTYYWEESSDIQGCQNASRRSHWRSIGSSWRLASSPASLSLTALVLLVRVHYYLKKWTTQKLLQGVIFLCSCTRSVFFLTVHFHWVYVTSHWDEQTQTQSWTAQAFRRIFSFLTNCLAFCFLARQQFCFCTGQKCIIQLKIESKFMRCGFDLYALPQTCASISCRSLCGLCMVSQAVSSSWNRPLRLCV